MNWWERSEWHAFTAAIIANPDDDTARLVAADWLDEQDYATASARAQLIRAQIAGTHLPFNLRPDTYAGRGFPESPYSRTVGLRISRGWPLWAVFLPHRFTAKIVGPVFKLAPLTTCSTLGMCAAQSYSANIGGQIPSHFDTYTLNPGPESVVTGEYSHGETLAYYRAREIRRLARSGANPHAEIYRRAGYIPAPIYEHLPTAGGPAAAVQRSRIETRKDEYRSAIKTAYAVLEAAWKCGREWAGQPRRIKNKKVTVCAEAAWLFKSITHDRYTRETADANQYDDGEPRNLPPAPNEQLDPWEPLARMKIQPAPNDDRSDQMHALHRCRVQDHATQDDRPPGAAGPVPVL